MYKECEDYKHTICQTQYPQGVTRVLAGSKNPKVWRPYNSLNQAPEKQGKKWVDGEPSPQSFLKSLLSAPLGLFGAACDFVVFVLAEGFGTAHADDRANCLKVWPNV